MSKTIWAHVLVCDEEKYIWYAVTSMIDYVDKVLIWDTGSQDATPQIIKEIKKFYPNKVETENIGRVDINVFTKIRNEMLKKTTSDWFIIVDGDEVWWDDSIREIFNIINHEGDHLDTIVSSYYNVVRDIYHHQDEAAGRYNFNGFTGHYNIRAVSRRITGLNFQKPHGQQGVYDGSGCLIQERDKKYRKVITKKAYLHFTHVIRSSSRKIDLEVPKRSKKLKYDLGRNFPLDFYYPEVFFRKRPEIVESVWEKATLGYNLQAFLQTPLRMFKRRFLGSRKSGY